MSWRMVCIGTGPGPKNVLAEDDSGRRVVFTYRVWKTLPKGAPMAESEGTYVVLQGIVQQFKKGEEWQPVLRTNQANGQNVSSFTIKTIPGQKLVGVSLWSEYEHVVPHVVKGMFVSLEGKMREETKNGTTYYNVTPSSLNMVAPVTRQERAVANAVPEAVGAAAPEAVAAAPEAVAAPASGTIF